MFSIRKKICIAALMVTGCQATSPTPPPEALNNRPLVIDEAMQMRDWEPVTARYPSGSTPAWPTDFFFDPSPSLPFYEMYIVDGGLFTFQGLVLPVTAAIQPPWKNVVYRGIVLEPSYTASPPLETDVQTIARDPAEGYR